MSTPLVIQLSSSRTPNSVQIFITFQATSLDCFSRTHGLLPASTIWESRPTLRREECSSSRMTWWDVRHTGTSSLHATPRAKHAWYTSSGRAQTAVATATSAVAATAAPVVRALAMAVSSAAATHGAWMVVVASHETIEASLVDAAGHKAAEIATGHALEIPMGVTTIEVRWHVGKVESARCPWCHVVPSQREMAVAIGIRARWSDVCRVQNVFIDQLEL